MRVSTHVRIVILGEKAVIVHVGDTQIIQSPRKNTGVVNNRSYIYPGDAISI